MGSLMQDFKRQASFFLKENIKKARLVLTDVTPIQILTEEVTNGDSLAPDAHAMRLISRAAFEVDDYERIVQILHHRLSKFDTWNWRASYNGVVLLEYLLTHGPQRIAEEFECDIDTIGDMANFHYVDEKGFNWGLRVQKKSERVQKLLEDSSYLKEERAKARKLITVGIKGFGSFNQKLNDERNSKEDNSHGILRSKSLFFDGGHHYHAADSYTRNDEYVVEEEEDHPFWDKERHTRVSLLSSV